MGINPVSSIASIVSAESVGTRGTRAQAPPAAGGAGNGSAAGSSPKQEVPVVQASAQAAEMPQDEVQVQRDSETNNEIVIRYVDGSGNLILQVPSSQLLKLARSIAQTFEEQASSRADRVEATSGNKGDSGGH